MKLSPLKIMDSSLKIRRIQVHLPSQPPGFVYEIAPEVRYSNM